MFGTQYSGSRSSVHQVVTFWLTVIQILILISINWSTLVANSYLTEYGLPYETKTKQNLLKLCKLLILNLIVVIVSDIYVVRP